MRTPGSPAAGKHLSWFEPCGTLSGDEGFRKGRPKHLPSAQSALAPGCVTSTCSTRSACGPCGLAGRGLRPRSESSLMTQGKLPSDPCSGCFPRWEGGGHRTQRRKVKSSRPHTGAGKKGGRTEGAQNEASLSPSGLQKENLRPHAPSSWTRHLERQMKGTQGRESKGKGSGGGPGFQL